MTDSKRTSGRSLTLACILLACAAWLVPAGARQAAPAAFVITHGPYLQLPSPTSMTIVWHTNRPAVSRVEYWVDGAGQPRVMTAVSAAHGLIDNDRTNHVIRLTGLQPQTTYRYRVISRDFQGYEKQHIVKYGETVSSDGASFRTLDQTNRPYSFAVFSDIHENAKRLDTMLAMVDWTRTPFVVFNGDMLNDFMNADQPFTGFVDVSVARLRSPASVLPAPDEASARQGSTRTIPFVYVRGNHDVRGRFARRLTDFFPASSEPDGRSRAYYSFDHGPVHFIVLDSGEDKVDSHEYYNGLVAFEPYRREQAAWLAEDLRSAAARGARYRVVFSHIPPYDGTERTGTSQEGFAIQQVRQTWEKVANAGRVNLWLSGHTHRFAYVAPSAPRSSPVPTGATADERGRGNRYHLVIGAPDTFARVDVSLSNLTVTVTRETGEVLKTVTVGTQK